MEVVNCVRVAVEIDEGLTIMMPIPQWTGKNCCFTHETYKKNESCSLLITQAVVDDLVT